MPTTVTGRRQLKSALGPAEKRKRRTASNMKPTSSEEARLLILEGRRLFAAAREVIKVHGINLMQWMILGCLCSNGRQILRDAARDLGVTDALVSMMARDLKKRGLVEDGPVNPNDGGERCMQVTVEGARLMDVIETEIPAADVLGSAA